MTILISQDSVFLWAGDPWALGNLPFSPLFLFFLAAVSQPRRSWFLCIPFFSFPFFSGEVCDYVGISEDVGIVRYCLDFFFFKPGGCEAELRGACVFMCMCACVHARVSVVHAGAECTSLGWWKHQQLSAHVWFSLVFCQDTVGEILEENGWKGACKPSFEVPLFHSSLYLGAWGLLVASTLFFPASSGLAGRSTPPPRILGCFSELMTPSILLPLKNSVNYKISVALEVWAAGIIEAVSPVKAKLYLQTCLILAVGGR